MTAALPHSGYSRCFSPGTSSRWEYTINFIQRNKDAQVKKVGKGGPGSRFSANYIERHSPVLFRLPACPFKPQAGFGVKSDLSVPS
ncbi:hypothetical protein PNOK_0897600 [Pyrrhoderma noxium]|uniref:Uncharacterized protein n=1 Tax=Pyrrhoderma noxium TaxID=2282107 RepID=A0A286U6L4_9AGAM|nr:hypothetical protein PNOK_0897600 [Pyrrhoderma noxium]